ncbi:MAG: BACON domain-containing protein [Synergistaceae bacterium]|nr:BACON domain-containing protein [Synergistaceae bacterium]
MRKKTNFLFLSLALMIFFAIVSGGCGGGGSSKSNGNSSSNKAVMLGNMTQERAQEVKDSNLYSYIEKRLSEIASVSTADENEDEDEFDIESLNNGDILFIPDASELLNIDDTTRNQILTAYYNLGVAVVAIYPDSEDIEAMEKLFNVSLSRPVSADGVTPLANPHYEFLALGWRQITDEGAANTFVYAGDHKENIEEFYGLDDKFESGDIVIERKKFNSDDEYAIEILKAYGLTDAEIKEFEKVFEELAAEYYEEYVESLFEWAAGLDKQTESITADFVADVAKLKAHVAAENDNKKEIEGFASGTYTQWRDSINMEFCNYFREFGDNKNNSAFKEFVYSKSGHSNYDRLLKYWSAGGSSNKTDGKAIPVKHEANASYRVISLHSFKNNADYYIITTDTTTKPVDLWICAPKGDRTRDELEGGDPGLSYYYDLIFGGNRGLSAKVWASVPEADIEKYMPNRTANKETTVNDTTAWNIGGGVTVGVEGGLNTGAAGFTLTGKLGTSFTWGISHETTKSWSVSDYEIVPNIHYDDGKQVAQWDLKCTWPTYSDKSDSWQMSSAFRRNVSFETESIWKVPASKRNEVKFYGQTLWINGFCWAHDMPSQPVKSYNAEVPHEGMTNELQTPRPPLLGVGDITTTGGKDAKMYTAKILSETDWTAASDSDWLTAVDKSGSATGENGEDFNYRVTENDTGRARVGNITVTAGNYVARITFTQSPYSE